jgi:sugar transferase EpsL
MEEMKVTKRMMDTAAASVLLLLFFPIMVITAVFIKKSMGGPVLFKQVRPGKDEVLFTLFKFRTMSDKRGEDGRLLPASERLTNTGKILRKFSLDELPQLWNVVRGDMSFVGPRPLLPEYLPRYSPEQKKRHTVKPGITGWAQVKGRNNLTWEQKFNYDIYYVENHSLAFDIKILFMTLWKVFKREGVDTAGEGGPFMGTTTSSRTAEK